MQHRGGIWPGEPSKTFTYRGTVWEVKRCVPGEKGEITYVSTWLIKNSLSDVQNVALSFFCWTFFDDRRLASTLNISDARRVQYFRLNAPFCMLVGSSFDDCDLEQNTDPFSVIHIRYTNNSRMCFLLQVQIYSQHSVSAQITTPFVPTIRMDDRSSTVCESSWYVKSIKLNLTFSCLSDYLLQNLNRADEDQKTTGTIFFTVKTI